MTSAKREWVITDAPCPDCGDVFRVLTSARQHGQGWWVNDGDPAECCGCGVPGTAGADGEGAWIDAVELELDQAGAEVAP